MAPESSMNRSTSPSTPKAMPTSPTSATTACRSSMRRSNTSSTSATRARPTRCSMRRRAIAIGPTIACTSATSATRSRSTTPMAASCARSVNKGVGPGQFNYPRDVALDADGNVYVADTDNDRLQKLDADLQPVWTLIDALLGRLVAPVAIAYSTLQGVLVSDTVGDQARVAFFRPNGEFEGMSASRRAVVRLGPCRLRRRHRTEWRLLPGGFDQPERREIQRRTDADQVSSARPAPGQDSSWTHAAWRSTTSATSSSSMAATIACRNSIPTGSSSTSGAASEPLPASSIRHRASPCSAIGCTSPTRATIACRSSTARATS